MIFGCKPGRIANWERKDALFYLYVSEVNGLYADVQFLVAAAKKLFPTAAFAVSASTCPIIQQRLANSKIIVEYCTPSSVCTASSACSSSTAILLNKSIFISICCGNDSIWENKWIIERLLSRRRILRICKSVRRHDYAITISR